MKRRVVPFAQGGSPHPLNRVDAVLDPAVLVDWKKNAENQSS